MLTAISPYSFNSFCPADYGSTFIVNTSAPEVTINNYSGQFEPPCTPNLFGGLPRSSHGIEFSGGRRWVSILVADSVESNSLQRLDSVSNQKETLTTELARLGERVPMKTLINLAKIVEQRLNFKQGKGPVGSLAMKYGLTKRLALPVHLSFVLKMAFVDEDMRHIAKMGLRIALKNPDTNGVPQGGFEPLYDLLEKWGYNRQGVLVDKEKFIARKLFMEASSTELTAPLTTPLHAKFNQVSANANSIEDDTPLLSLLITYFTQIPKPKTALAG